MRTHVIYQQHAPRTGFGTLLVVDREIPRAMRILPAIALCACLFVVHQCPAQLFDLGIKAGVNQDNFQTSFDHTALIGGHAGIFARVKPPILPGIQAEILASTWGSTVSSSGVSADLRSATIQIPVFLIFSLGPVELHGGAYYDRYLTKEFDVNIDAVIEGETIQVDNLADGGYGLLGGAGVRLGHFYAGARYNVGLNDIGSGPILSDVQTRQFQAYIGFGLFKPSK